MNRLKSSFPGMNNGAEPAVNGRTRISGFVISDGINAIGVDESEKQSHQGSENVKLIRQLPEAASYPYHALSPRKEQKLVLPDIVIEGAEPSSTEHEFDWISIVLQPLGSLLAVIILMLLLKNSISSGAFMLIGAVSGVLGIVWGILRFIKQKKDDTKSENQSREKYQQYLDEKIAEMRKGYKRQLEILREESPSGSECAHYSENTPSLYSVSIETSAFLRLRMGTGRVENAQHVIVPQSHYKEENALNDEARDLVASYRNLKDAPVRCALRQCGSLGIVGERNRVVHLCQSLLVQATSLHNYEELKIVLVYPDNEKDAWERLRFLPHFMDSDQRLRYLASDRDSAQDLLQNITELMDQRLEESKTYSYSAAKFHSTHYLVVVADMGCLNGNSLGHELCANREDLGFSTVFLSSDLEHLPKDCAVIAELTADTGKFYRTAALNDALQFRPDGLQPGEWEHFVSMLAPIRLENPKMSKGIPYATSFFDTYGVTDTSELNIPQRWQENRPEVSMAVPLGKGENRKVETFNIHPNAEGPHGLFVGGTGSGKTTMIRSWVLSMAANFSPERVNFVLVDFREPGLLTGLRNLPHVTGTIGKLDTDIERNLTALKSEISRREKLFDAADVSDINTYLRKHYDNRQEAAEPMPFLFIVVDELNEFKMWSRDDVGNNWMSLLEQLYQTGRALGIHIIAGSQTPSPFTSVMSGNAHFRWCLRTNEPSDSKAMLGCNAAYEITAKGRAFIAVGSSKRELQTMYADEPYYTPLEKNERPEREMALVSLQGQRKIVRSEERSRKSELDQLTAYMQTCCMQSHIPLPSKLWAPPLPEQLLYPVDGGGQSLCATVGIVDDPARQSQYPLQIDLLKTGSFLLQGAIQTGKTTFLRTFAFSLLEKTSPDILGLYIIQSNAGDFSGFEAYPQVMDIVEQYDAAETVKTLSLLLEQRQKSGKKTEKMILLLIDNINAVYVEHRDALRKILQQGPSQGILVAAAATAGGGSVSSIEPLVKTGFCLWLSESRYDYSSTLHSGKVNSIPSKDVPGRGLANIGRVVSFQTYQLLPENREKELSAFLKERAKYLWGDPLKSQPEPVQCVRGEFSVGMDQRNKSVIHDFGKCASLLILSDHAGDRKRLLISIGKKLAQQYETQALLTLGFTVDIPGACAPEVGEPLDHFLDDMRAELNQRYQKREKSEKPFVFLIDNCCSVLACCSAEGLNRIDKNLLLNGSRYSILTVLACSYADFSTRYAAEDGSMVVPLRRAAAGRVLLLDAKPELLPLSLLNKGNIEKHGNYYLGENCSMIIPELDRSE